MKKAARIRPCHSESENRSRYIFRPTMNANITPVGGGHLPGPHQVCYNRRCRGLCGMHGKRWRRSGHTSSTDAKLIRRGRVRGGGLKDHVPYLYRFMRGNKADEARKLRTHEHCH